MTTSTALETTKPDHSIRISSWKRYDENKWREAIMFFINGLWGDKATVAGHPIIEFGDVTLRLVKSLRYVAYTDQDDKDDEGDGYDRQQRYEARMAEMPADFLATECIETDDTPLQVHDGLMRFVRSPKVRLITIRFYGGGSFTLWKTENRGEYGMTRWGLGSRQEFNLEQVETVVSWR